MDASEISRSYLKIAKRPSLTVHAFGTYETRFTVIRGIMKLRALMDSGAASGKGRAWSADRRAPRFYPNSTLILP